MKENYSIGDTLIITIWKLDRKTFKEYPIQENVSIKSFFINWKDKTQKKIYELSNGYMLGDRKNADEHGINVTMMIEISTLESSKFYE